MQTITSQHEDFQSASCNSRWWALFPPNTLRPSDRVLSAVDRVKSAALLGCSNNNNACHFPNAVTLMEQMINNRSNNSNKLQETSYRKLSFAAFQGSETVRICNNASVSFQLRKLMKLKKSTKKAVPESLCKCFKISSNTTTMQEALSRFCRAELRMKISSLNMTLMNMRLKMATESRKLNTTI